MGFSEAQLVKTPIKQGISMDVLCCNPVFSVVSRDSLPANSPSIRFSWLRSNQWHKIGVYTKQDELLKKRQTKSGLSLIM
jgi:hypothetical protein